MKLWSATEFAQAVDSLPNPASNVRRMFDSSASAGSGSLDELRSILPFLPVDDARGNGSIDFNGSENWLGMTWAVRREYGDDAKEPYRERCTTSARYDDEGFDQAWRAYDAGHPNPITIKSVYALAKNHGWAGHAPTPLKGRYKLLTGTAINALPPMEWCVKGLLPDRGLAAIYGASASGKSFLAIDLSLAIAAGKPWSGNRVKPRTVIYITLEGEAGLQKRLNAWRTRNCADVPQNFYAIVQPLNLLERQDVIDLIAALPQGCVVFIDTLNRAAPGADENSAVDMGNIIAALKQISEATDALVIPIHHTGKDQARGLRGHSSLFAALDGAIEVERTAHGRTFRAAKVKDGNDGEKTGFRLDVVSLGIDSDGDAITSCVVAADDAVIIERRLPRGAKQRAVLEAIKAVAPLPLEEAITVVAPIVSATKNRQRTTAHSTIVALVKDNFLQFTGGDRQQVSVR
jgi:hypothetical protein